MRASVNAARSAGARNWARPSHLRSPVFEGSCSGLPRIRLQSPPSMILLRRSFTHLGVVVGFGNVPSVEGDQSQHVLDTGGRLPRRKYAIEDQGAGMCLVQRYGHYIF